MNEIQRQELAAMIDRYSEKDTVSQTIIPKLSLMKSETKRVKTSTVYMSSLCLIV